VINMLKKRTPKPEYYFVDLASNDAVFLSNTLALEREGNWNGLCIEPNQGYWHGLSHRKCTLASTVIGKHDFEIVDFRDDQGALGGIVGYDQKEKTGGHPYFTSSLQTIFEMFRVPKEIDYLSLDVEGAEEFIMSTFPFETYRISILTIERPNDGLRKLLDTHGYKLVVKELTDFGETVWVHESFGMMEEMMKSVMQETIREAFCMNRSNVFGVTPWHLGQAQAIRKQYGPEEC